MKHRSRHPRVVRHAAIRAGYGGLAALGLTVALLAATALPVRAQSGPGTEIRNVATCDFAALPAGSPAPPTTSVPSNPVTTMVVRDDCFAAATVALSVEPEAQVAPGETLTYTILLTNPWDVPLRDVVAGVRLDPALDDPHEQFVLFDPDPDGTPPPITTTWDGTQRLATWSLASLSPGTSARFVVRAIVPAETPRALRMVATATLAAADCTDEPAIPPVETEVSPPELQVLKRADRSTAIVGDAVTYVVDVAHAETGTGLDPVTLVDRLPPGFRFVAGSARIDGAAAGDPDVDADGHTLRFDLGPFAAGAARRVQYAAHVTPAARRAEAHNRAYATGTTPGDIEITSPPATASVFVVAGPFDPEGTIAGRVFVDRNGNGIPGDDEPGVPGVFVFLEDGRGSVTDIHGRWHVEGVRPGVHAVRIEPATLPPKTFADGADAEATGTWGSRFVELRPSTLAVVDLPVGPRSLPTCTLTADARRLTLPAAVLIDPGGVPTGPAKAHLERAARALAGAVAPVVAAVRCEPPTAETGMDELERLWAERLSAGSSRRVRREIEVAPALLAPAPQNGPTGTDAATVEGDAPDDPLAERIRTVPAETAILSPTPDARVARGVSTVEVVYPSDHQPDLRVNGVPVPATRIGMRASLPRRNLTAARYIGVPLEPGRNELEFRAIPPGTSRPPEGRVSRWIVAPGEAAEIRLDVPGERWIADAVTPGIVQIVEVDGAGVRTSGRTVVTLVVDGAGPTTTDRDPVEPGFQVRLDDGMAEVRFAPTSVPGRVRVDAFAGDLEAEIEIPITPGATAWRVLGIAEGRSVGDGGVEGDGGTGPTTYDPITDDGGRIAFYARGPVGDSMQLTARVDTDRDRDRDRLSTEIEPYRYWSVYGDDAVAVEEAASQGKVFLRLDGPAGFARWGDFASGFSSTELARYDRRLHGLSGRVDRSHVSFEGFASESDQSQVRDVFEPDGTSGPFVLGTRPVVSLSETVVVEVRERFEPDRVVSRRVLLRDLDYDLDPAAGTILLRAPLAPFDINLNPLRLVVLYESRGGADRWTTGGRLAIRTDERFELGTTAILEQREGEDMSLYGVDARWQPVAGTRIRAELASSDVGEGADLAYRIEVGSRTRPDLTWDVSWRDLPAGFSNGSYLGAPELGSRRGRGMVVWDASRELRVRGEATHQIDDVNDLTRSTAAVDVEHDVGPFTMIGGLTHARSEGASVGSGDSTLLRAGLRGRWAERWTMELLRDEPLSGGDALGFPGRTRAGLGYQLRPGLRAFALQEWEDGDNARDRTSAGVEGRITETTRASHRWFMDDAADGRAIRSATAVEAVVPVRPGHRLSAIASRVWTADGDDTRDGTVLGGGYEIRAGRSLFTGRYEVRLGEVETRHLTTAAGALRFGQAWSMLVRERLTLSDPSGGGTASAQRAEGIVALAYRPTGRRWQMLARVDHSTGGGTATSVAGVSPGAPTEPSGEITDTVDGIPAGIGTGIGREATVFDRDSWALSLAGGARLTARQRIAITWIGRRVEADDDDGLPSTFTDLTSLHWSARVHDRWTVGASVRRFDQRESGLATVGYGGQVGFRAVEDLWVVAGWNAAGTRDDRNPGVDRVDDGTFVSIRFRFDEGTFADWFR